MVPLDQQTSQSKARAGYMLAVVLYGTIGMFLRYINLPSEFVALARGLIGAAFVLVYLRVRRHARPDIPAIRKRLGWLVLAGILLGLNWIFLFAAYTITTVAIASLCNYMAPIIVILIAPVCMNEKLDRRKLPCVAAALIGMVLVSGVIGGHVGRPLGIVLGLAAAACFVGIVICNRKTADVPSLDKSVVQLFMSALTVLPYLIIANRGRALHADTRSILIILMLGLLHTGVAYCMYFHGMTTLPVHTVALLGYLEPVVSVFCSAVFLHEPMTLEGWIGAVLIIGAAAVSERMPQAPEASGSGSETP